VIGGVQGGGDEITYLDVGSQFCVIQSVENTAAGGDQTVFSGQFTNFSCNQLELQQKEFLYKQSLVVGNAQMSSNGNENSQGTYVGNSGLRSYSDTVGVVALGTKDSTINGDYSTLIGARQTRVSTGVSDVHSFRQLDQTFNFNSLLCLPNAGPGTSPNRSVGRNFFLTMNSYPTLQGLLVCGQSPADSTGNPVYVDATTLITDVPYLPSMGPHSATWVVSGKLITYFNDNTFSVFDVSLITTFESSDGCQILENSITPIHTSTTHSTATLQVMVCPSVSSTLLFQMMEGADIAGVFANATFTVTEMNNYDW
jgi:hypothetical protein